ncbi:hypothetical protein SAMN04488527_1204 [Aliiroseovarius crassostreae]|uniref:Sulfotransferase domain-containing protein n=1 Tax=Aliiroseovarius crassostreae TaxID=154981 RepID=A0A0P7JR55_9RHOB|nr:hypothetical protein [Aliiroseovarius crassostreae]KPN63877.1 hypothetical protein AKJ29_14415 [Aliiroseovarius crassostreae]SFU82833.1 hypothetical protein SAMN04488527_1204 [Aliiroseovarius crassostreae]
MYSSPIAIYIGSPFTNGEQIAWSLRKDPQLFDDEGLLIRRPGTYQKQVKTARNDLLKGELSEEQRSLFLQQVIGDHQASRIVLSDHSYIGEAAWMLNQGCFFPNAARNTQALRSLFREYELEFFLSIQNPATLIPAAFRSQKKRTLEEFLSGSDLITLRWSTVLIDILDANPETPLTVWCNEETPVIWPNILRAVADLPKEFCFGGELDIIQGALEDAAMTRLQQYLGDRPWLNESQRRGIYRVFLNRFYSEDVVEEEIDIPGWDQELVDEMTDIYMDDLKLINRMREVRFLTDLPT